MESESNKLFVGGITQSTTATNLREYFSKYGQVKNAQVMKNRLTGVSRGFGFVSFSDQSSMERALQNQEHEILGRRVAVNIPRAIEKKPLREDDSNRNSSPLKINKIFVGGLPTSLTKEEFDGYFQTFGRIMDSVIMCDKENKPRGFGFVTYDSEESVQKVVMNRFHQLSNKWVDVKRAIPRGQAPTNFCGHYSYQGSMGFGHSSSGYLSYQMPCPTFGSNNYLSYQMPCPSNNYLSYQMPCTIVGAYYYGAYPSYYLNAPFMDYHGNGFMDYHGNGRHYGPSSSSSPTSSGNKSVVMIQELDVVEENGRHHALSSSTIQEPEGVDNLASRERSNKLQLVLHTNGVASHSRSESSGIVDNGKPKKNEGSNVVLLNGHSSDVHGDSVVNGHGSENN